MLMEDEIPKGKLNRSIAGGKTAAKVGGKVLKYLAKKPFLSKEEKALAKEDLDQKSAKILFKGFSLLKGTALKIAQQLSFATDALPPAIQKELEKSYNHVPPINRALVRKVLINAFGMQPEKVFQKFDPAAFSAASLGQVHLAVAQNNDKLAVKIQYPGIEKTIKSDIQLVKSLLRPLPDYKMIQPVIKEIETRLFEELNYIQEANNINHFAKNLNLTDVIIPSVNAKASTDKVLSMEYIDGPVLSEWIETDPPQKERDKIAQILNDIFLKSLFEMNCIHADPNPGNFIIQDDLKVGLVDFGCVKRFDHKFVSLYRKVPKAFSSGNRAEYLPLLKSLNFTQKDLDPEADDEVCMMIYKFGKWITRPFNEEYFDFKSNNDFFLEGKELNKEYSKSYFKFRNQFDINPDIIFLSRTCYGLFRLFQRMGARVKMRNLYEWE